MPLFSQHNRHGRDASAYRADRDAQASHPAERAGHVAPQNAQSAHGAIPAAPVVRRGVAPQPAASATASILLKRYRPLRTRAQGGFGSVEVCLDSRLQRRVAIKRIPLAAPLDTTPEDARADALAEARTASLLQHPNIVTVIDFAYDSAYAYLVMEYVDGMSLEEFLAAVDGNSLTYDECACIADALVQALQFAHENGVLHLDIKPANVLIDRSGHVKLTDFGMATLTSAAGFGGARGGTIGYMPPEQLRGETVDERSDIFALAAVLYESLCATAPFRAGAPADSLKRIDKGVIYPSSLLADIPENSEEALLCALSPDPAERMASVADFGDWFLPNLGSAREGRKSLARMIEKLTADTEDEDAAEDAQATGHRRVWELDPAEGYLGSRTPHARRIVTGIVGGVATAACIMPVLATMGLDERTGLLAALAIGVAGGIAPQIGSVLVATGFLMMVFNATNLIAVLPAAVVFLALFAGWWYAWGRVLPAASAALTACMAAAAATGNPLILAGPAAAFAAYLLPPLPAAVSSGLGALLSRWLVLALQAGGALETGPAFASLADPPFLIGVVLVAAAAAATSAALGRHAQNMLDARGSTMFGAACAAMGIMVVLLLALANPMEIAGGSTTYIAEILGAGTLSSIIIGMCVYLMGYRRNLSEGD